MTRFLCWKLVGVLLFASLGSTIIRASAETPIGDGAPNAGEAGGPSTSEIALFETRIRPILADHCWKCHGPSDQKAGLRLDSAAAIRQGGESGPAVIGGKLDESPLLLAIRYEADGAQMPPSGKLSEEAIASLTEWIEGGMPWPNYPDLAATAQVPPQTGPSSTNDEWNRRRQHWSLQPVGSPAVPEVANRNWARGAVDQFVLAKLEAAGLSPANEAPADVVVRRLCLTLLGLPPAFVMQVRAKAGKSVSFETQADYEELVDWLLTSPQFGERMARHWLDIVRYAETSGHEFDFAIPFAPLYRDYVVRAFNADVPFNQFAMEHLAGDLLPDQRIDPATGRNESVVGTAFWWLGQGKHSPVDLRQEECDLVDNQLDVFSKAFLGLTVACARCHDHKFDAITAADYYALAGFLQSSRQDWSDTAFTAATFADMEAAEFARRERDQRLFGHTATQIANAIEQPVVREALRNADRTSPLGGLAAIVRVAAAQPQALAMEFEKVRGSGERWLAFRKQADVIWPVDSSGSGLAEDDSRIAREPWRTSGRAFWNMPHTTSPLGSKGHSTSSPTQAISLAPDSTAGPIQFVPPAALFSGRIAAGLEGAARSPTFVLNKRYLDVRVMKQGGASHPPRANQMGTVSLIVDGFHFIRDPLYGNLSIAVPPNGQSTWYRIDLSRHQGRTAYVEIEDLDDGQILVEQVWLTDSEAMAGDFDPAADWLSRQLADVASGDMSRQVFEIVGHLLTGELADSPVLADVQVSAVNGLLKMLQVSGQPVALAASVQQQVAGLEAKWQTATQRLPRPVYALGLTDGTAENEHVLLRGNAKKPGPVVQRRALASLGGELPGLPESGSGRLQLGQQLFRADNPLFARVVVNRVWKSVFGVGLVSTPDDFGAMGRAPSHPELLDYLAGEFVRDGWSIKKLMKTLVMSAAYRQQSVNDSALATERDPNNVLLHKMRIQRMEGEVVRDTLLVLAGRLQTQPTNGSVPVHLTGFMDGRGRPGASGPLDGAGRRSIYLEVRRNFLSPFFQAFDYPTPFTTVGMRTSSNVPAQTLALQNNPLVLELTEAWALGSQHLPDPPRARQLFREAYGTDPNEAELAALLEFVATSDEATTNAAWTTTRWPNLCHALVCSKRFLFIE